VPRCPQVAPSAVPQPDLNAKPPRKPRQSTTTFGGVLEDGVLRPMAEEDEESASGAEGAMSGLLNYGGGERSLVT
jgi:hypothetical protein